VKKPTGRCLVPKAILDASALLALLLGEAGAPAVEPYLSDSCISAVNYSEVLARTSTLCGSLEEAKRRVDYHDVDIIEFDAAQAALVASLFPTTRFLGLSLADRACLALGLSMNLVVVTADRAWKTLDIGVRIELIR
jgi:ribonuclease VapC